MTRRMLFMLVRVTLALLALAVAGTLDLLFHPGIPWVLFFYILPIVLSVSLPIAGVLGIALLTLGTSLSLALLGDETPWSGMRIVSMVEIVLLAVMALLVRSSRDDLRLSNQRVSGILDGSNTGFVRTTPDLTLIDANEPWLRMVGLRRLKDVKGSRLTDWFPEDRRRTAQAMLAFLDAGDRRSFETVIRQRAGLRIHVVITAYAERVGDRIQIAAVFADVTAIRRAEAQARASEQQLRSHLDNTPLAAIVLDGSHQIRDWNRSAEQIFGYGRQAVLGTSAWELVPPEERGRRSSPFGVGDSEGAAGSRRLLQFTRDQRRITVQWYHTPLRSPDGEVRQVASLGLDVTRQEQMEQALRVSETKFSSVFQQSPDALLLVRFGDAQLLEANQTVERMFGWTRAELHDAWHEREGFFSRDADGAAFTKLLVERGEVEAFEAELMRRDGSVLAVLLSGRRLQIGGEDTLLLTIRDLTPIREGEQERNRLQQQLQQAQRLEGIGRLAGGVAHDFNNMLAGIQGYSELIQAQAHETAQVEHYSQRILETTQRAADLVSKLLTFSRQGAIEKRYFELGKVMHDTLDLFAQTLDPRVRVEVREDRTRIAVYGDESQISNALLNLCINARDALGEGGDIVVELRTEDLDAAAAAALDPDLSDGRYVRLSVQDGGCGISARQLEDIFVPFYTTKPKGQGTGLGLPSVYGAVKAHGGTVRVSSRVGRGSTFSLYLPAWPASLILEADARSARTDPGLRGRRVLVVDDEEALRETLSKSLESFGCRVAVASGGREGLQLFEAAPGDWDLVLLDVTMPGMSGEELFRIMRDLRADVQVILMSGFDRTALLQRALLEGAAGVLKKPFSRDELLREMERVELARPTDPAPRLRIVRSD